MSPPLAAFTGYGIEIEYAIVDRATLDVRPIADRLLADAAGQAVSEYEDGPIAWSNELSLHVIELKTNGPAASLDGLGDAFARSARHANDLLAAHDACLLPCAMHPWMDPDTEQRLWPHEQNEIYAAYDRIFGCRGHGWANLQSMHINLPFADDAEFVRLHDAIRVVLPLLPALSAASPFADGRATGYLDTRLEVYRANQARVPEITGAVIPERVSSIDEYHTRILAPMYAAIGKHDADGVLAGEWLNSRGAIARFDRHTIEIRLLDSQESPRADLALARVVCAVIRHLYDAPPRVRAAQTRVDPAVLAKTLRDAIQDGERSHVENADYLCALGLASVSASAGEIWRALARASGVAGAKDVERLLARAPLARWLIGSAGSAPTRDRLRTVYRELCGALITNEIIAIAGAKA